jgi:hypothetical protein
MRLPICQPNAETTLGESKQGAAKVLSTKSLAGERDGSKGRFL